MKHATATLDGLKAEAIRAAWRRQARAQAAAAAPTQQQGLVEVRT